MSSRIRTLVATSLPTAPVAARVPVSQARALQRQASAQNTTTSALVRQALGIAADLLEVAKLTGSTPAKVLSDALAARQAPALPPLPTKRPAKRAAPAKPAAATAPAQPASAPAEAELTEAETAVLRSLRGERQRAKFLHLRGEARQRTASKKGTRS